ncbi:RNA polymerase sigma factor [Listeria sp. PSOL-1]|uniref:RNA polymerase sigma factor n=1 Tax=Listeria sp. PSOL-1 TaxID=1844999 RepID=UPI0013D6EC36|nr:RNA polymerase sigma factor [Listeria sp. PSOL-1]
MKEDMEECFLECIAEYKDDFYRLAFSYVKTQTDALDIIQESIQKALLHLNSIKKKEAIKSWFYKIVVRTSLDFLRKKKKVTLMDHETMGNLNTYTEDQYENIDLKEALERLPTKYKTVIILRYFEELSLQEISYIINRNLSTTKTRLYKALKLLRLDISEEDLHESK